jgi:hypothetical protein
MTFTHTEEFYVPEKIIKKMVTVAIVYIDDGVEIREAVYSAYVRYIKELPNGISAVYEKLERELIDRITEYFCEAAFGEED